MVEGVRWPEWPSLTLPVWLTRWQSQARVWICPAFGWCVCSSCWCRLPQEWRPSRQHCMLERERWRWTDALVHKGEHRSGNENSKCQPYCSRWWWVRASARTLNIEVHYIRSLREDTCEKSCEIRLHAPWSFVRIRLITHHVMPA